MANPHGETYMYTFNAVREKAPSASGVYTIHTPRRWVFVGESEDIRLSLFRHLNEEDVSMTRFGPLSFSFELLPPAERGPRQKALIAELEPECAAEQLAPARP
jgi:hypothetical protein